MSQNVVQDNTVIASELDYKTLASSVPNYRLSMVLPQAGSQTVTITPAGGQETIFEIPVKAFNLAESVLNFKLATPVAADTKYNWMAENALTAIQQIQLYTRSGQYLCDLQHVSNYLQIVNFKETPLSILQSNDAKNRFYPSNKTAANNLRPTGGAANRDYVEPAYLQVSAQEAGAGQSVITQQIQFRLSNIYNTIFSLNKDLLFPEVINLRIVWSAGNRISWYSDANNNPTTNATAAAGNHLVSELVFYLAIETNQDIVNSLQMKMNSTGLSIPVDYIHQYKTNLGSTSQTVSQKFNRAHGATLKKMIHSVFSNTQTLNSAFDHQNINGAKVSSLYTLLDNNRLQEFNLTSSTDLGQDYMYLKPMLKGTPCMSQNIYHYNWFWCDDFSYISKDKNVVSGLDLVTERKWDIFMTTANSNFNHYTFAVVQKILTITGNQMTFL